VLGGAAGADTMDTTKIDPLAVPVSTRDQAGGRAAMPWTPERQAKAQPKPLPDIDPAAVRDAAQGFRSAADSGPQQQTAAVVLADPETAPIGAQTGSGSGDGGDYWTPERLRSTKPMPMPQINDEQFRKLIRPGQNNR
jgi:hypothetical protein